jgi:outer membrane lipoprotein-sorting protein
MTRLPFVAALAIGLASLSSAAIATAQGVAASPAALNVLAGNWNCTSHGPNGTSTATIAFTQVVPNLVQYSYVVTSGKSAGHKGAGEWLYDTKKAEYVAMGAGISGWGVSRGPASAGAMVVTLTDTYPSDPTNGTTTYRFTSSTISYTSDWKKNGKPMHRQQTCTKA